VAACRLALSLALSSGSELHSLAGPEQFRAYLDSIPPLWPVYLVLAAFMVAGVAGLGRQAWQRRARGGANGTGEAAFILLVWLLAPPLFFLIFPAPPVLHYLLPSYPVPFVAGGVGFALTAGVARRRSAHYLPLILWATLLAAVSLQLWGTIQLHQLVARQATPGGFSTPLSHHLQAAGQAVTLWERRGGEILVVSAGENPAIDNTAAVYDALLSGIPRRFVDVRRSALFPDEPAVVLLAADVPPDSAAAQIYQDGGKERVQVPLRPGEGAVEVLQIGDPPQPAMTLAEPVLFANWVRLFGYDPLQSGTAGSASWRLYWHPGDNPDPADYHLFNHLLDGGGNRIAQADAAAFAPWQWRSGDTVVSVFVLDLPEAAPPPLTMRVGFYRYPSIDNVPVLDVALNPAADAVELPAE
jgi:hypothetical protein